MRLHFTKMHGCGNDYIYFDCFDRETAEKILKDPSGLAIRLSNRHFSIGGDGIVLICPSDVADAKMRMFNIDGSEGKMCGNAIRCVGKYLHDVREIEKSNLTVETLSGIKSLDLVNEDGKTVFVSVDMGAPILEGKLIPTLFEGPVVGETLNIAGDEYEITCVSMGNPHCVVFTDDINSIELEKTGPLFENNSVFPERVNTEFIKVIDKNNLEMRVWERGSGETFACGTGACAACVAAVLNGFCRKGEEVKIKLLGGDLFVTYFDNRVIMKGGAEIAFEGIVDI